MKKIILALILVGFNIVTSRAEMVSEFIIERFDSVAVCQVSEWKELAKFKDGELVEKSPDQKLIWARLKLTKYLKMSAITPEFVNVLFYQTVPPEGSVILGNAINIENLRKGPFIVLINIVGGLCLTEAEIYPNFSFSDIKDQDGYVKYFSTKK